MELINREDYEKILQENKVVFVCFYTTWCPPCRMLRPILEEYMENNPDKSPEEVIKETYKFAVPRNKSVNSHGYIINTKDLEFNEMGIK